MGHPKGLRLPFALPDLLEELRRTGREARIVIIERGVGFYPVIHDLL